MAGGAFALPQGGSVAAGSAEIRNAGSHTVVFQGSDRAVVDWRSFDVAPGEEVHFVQAGAGSAILNRIHDTDASRIDGALTANGQVYITNPNGMVFGHGAQVDVGSLVATTADISDSAFMKGGALTFDKAGNPSATISNAGTISVKEGGLAALVAPNVSNSGVIAAKSGTVALAAGDTMTVDFYGDDLLSVAVSDAVTRQSASNTGRLSATDGGTVMMTTAQASSVIDSVINMNGIADASSATDEGGVIVFAGQDADITLGSNASVKATGNTGGGTVRIGGEYQGKGTTPTAKTTTIAKGAAIDASAIERGNGGEVIVWADDTTVFAGDIKARGGAAAGDGGFAEVSGKEQLGMAGEVDLTAPQGSKGILLLDPATITVYGNVDPAYQSTDGSINLNGSLQIWFDPFDLDGDGDTTDNPANGATVATWKDKGPYAASANKTVLGPTFATVGIGGKPSIFFQNVAQGSDSNVLTPGSQLVGTASDSYTYFIITQPDPATAAVASRYMVSYGGGGAINKGYLFQLWNNGDLYSYQAANNDFYATTRSTAFPYDGQGHLFGQVSSYNNPNYSAVKYLDAAHYGVDVAVVGTLQHADATINYRIGANNYQGYLGDIIKYGIALPDNARNLVEQYQSGKWGIALTPPGAGATEVAQATAADGYSGFTTRYLERLSQSADVSLQATQDISFDLKGDTLNVGTAGRSLTFTAGNQISSASAGAITTNGGNITMTATAGVLDIHNVALTTNGGAVSLTSGGAMNLPSISASSITAQTTGATADITLAAGNTLSASAAGTAMTLASGDDFINQAGAGALSAPAGRWLVYSEAPSEDTPGGVAPGFTQYGCIYGSCSPSGTNNGFLYRSSPFGGGGSGGGGGGAGGTPTTPEEPIFEPDPLPPLPGENAPLPIPPSAPPSATNPAPPSTTSSVDGGQPLDVARITMSAPIVSIGAQEGETATAIHTSQQLLQSKTATDIGGELITYSPDLLAQLGCAGDNMQAGCNMVLP